MQVLHDVRQEAIAQVQDSSPDASTSKTAKAPQGARACLLACETTSARVTLNGTPPASNNGFVLPKDQNPMYLPVGEGVTITWRSTAGTASVVNTSWLF